jgi:prepilin-type N-terminal cleavage/methylation domain-containing protein
MNNDAGKQRGFTLIEMLVVLIITALVSGVLFQALERSYSLQRRFGTELFKVQQGQMAIDWYRQTVQGLYPDQPNASNIFKGDAVSFTGLTTNPLGEEYGAPTPIQWALVARTDQPRVDLVYREHGQDTVIASWQGTEAKFAYYDEQQVAHDTWPPALGLFPQLPRQVQLEARDNGEPVTIVTAPMGPKEALLRPQDLFKFTP